MTPDSQSVSSASSLTIDKLVDAGSGRGGRTSRIRRARDAANDWAMRIRSRPKSGLREQARASQIDGRSAAQLSRRLRPRFRSGRPSATLNWHSREGISLILINDHQGFDTTGTNALQHVAAKFTVGRPMAAGEDVTRQAEAMFGGYIAARDFKREEEGRPLPFARDAAGNNTVRVDVLRHQHPRGEQASRQICEAGLIQAEGRARAGLRGDDEPLAIFRWTDVPLPELRLAGR